MSCQSQHTSDTVFHGPGSTSEAGLMSEQGLVSLAYSNSGCPTPAMRKATWLHSFVFSQHGGHPYSVVDIRGPAALIVRTGFNGKVNVGLLILNFQCFYTYSNEQTDA